MNIAFKKNFSLLLKNYPIFFDALKRISRLFGDSNPEYNLLKEYFKYNKCPSVIQIGANDGISNDPIREFILHNSKCKAYLIEPIPHLFLKLQKSYSKKQQRRISLFQCAISKNTGFAPIYKFKPEALNNLPFYADQLASFDIEHLIKTLPNKENYLDKIESINTVTYTFDDFIKQKYINSIDICIIDTEGHEKQIIETIPFSKVKPDIIIFEMLHATVENKNFIYQILTNQLYLLYSFDLDTIAIQNTLQLNWKKHFINLNFINL